MYVGPNKSSSEFVGKQAEVRRSSSGVRRKFVGSLSLDNTYTKSSSEFVGSSSEFVGGVVRSSSEFVGGLGQRPESKKKQKRISNTEKT